MSPSTDVAALVAEAEALADHEAQAAAEARVEAAKVRLDEAQAELVKAGEAEAAARKALDDLAAGAASGPMATAAAVMKAAARLRMVCKVPGSSRYLSTYSRIFFPFKASFNTISAAPDSTISSALVR